MEFKKIEEPLQIANNAIVRLKDMGHIKEVLYTEKRSYGGYITKISKENYIDNRTGEMFDYKLNENRAQSYQELKRSLNNGRDLINTNCTDLSKCRFITVTYAQRENKEQEPIPMTDQVRLYKNLKSFIQRLRREYGHFEFITCCEPQGSGSWHAHIILIYNSQAPYMPNDKIAALWAQGFVTVKRIKDEVDNVGAYLTAYLCDVDYNEYIKENPNYKDKKLDIKEVEIEDENGVKHLKKYVKGARLHYYPSQFHPFRWSRGIKKPIITNESYKEVKEKVSSGKLTFTKTIAFEDIERNFKNKLQYEYYNTKLTTEKQVK